MKNDLLKQYVSLRDSLTKEKTALEARLAEINLALGTVSTAAVASKAASTDKAVAPKAPGRVGRPPGKSGKRAQNSKSLRDTVVEALAQKPLNRQEILDAVLKSGYVFSAKDPLNSLSTLLYTDKKTFKNKDGKFSAA
jgi:hypothetical protein